jgi:hypothetical protein
MHAKLQTNLEQLQHINTTDLDRAAEIARHQLKQNKRIRHTLIEDGLQSDLNTLRTRIHMGPHQTPHVGQPGADKTHEDTNLNTAAQHITPMEVTTDTTPTSTNQDHITDSSTTTATSARPTIPGITILPSTTDSITTTRTPTTVISSPTRDPPATATASAITTEPSTIVETALITTTGASTEPGQASVVNDTSAVEVLSATDAATAANTPTITTETVALQLPTASISITPTVAITTVPHKRPFTDVANSPETEDGLDHATASTSVRTPVPKRYTTGSTYRVPEQLFIIDSDYEPDTDDTTDTWVIPEDPTEDNITARPTPRNQSPAPTTPRNQSPSATKRNFETPSTIKRTWMLQTHTNPKAVIIGDSNMRLGSAIRDGWEVHTYPGMTLGTATDFVERSTLPAGVTKVVFAVGINNKGSSPTTITADFHKLARAAAKKDWDFHFVGVSVAEGKLGDKEMDTINKLNDVARGRLVEKFVPPLPMRQVRTQPLDQTHHTPETVNHILQTIFQTIDLN